ncbi:Uncharacterised protein [Mycobacteroides abscessus subsp. bolletii]|uniref:hypothetical protein n=1 Tax=Mycobacteroides abscessus TaxID=36809 RepID=UPI0009A737FD|nr:hypothetical protein [Mycobacteroides abscessus]SKR94495.1 Uncharacterised protein [Mycobacteroides abscessus subsp. bolletii]SKS03065.1 Uncharacterised protein [Mycobacteroides abscessus subsp. bolletii]DAZ90117.1 TPA_asm: hypothetical protein PROPHIFVLQ01-1_30 [Mycobacterium phage prophiFVLQ01-1]
MTHPFTPTDEAQAIAWYANVEATLDTMINSHPESGPIPAMFIAGMMTEMAPMRPDLKMGSLIDLLVVAIDRLARQRGTTDG